MLLALLTVVATWYGAHGRRFNDTGSGTIIFEEAWTIPELAFQFEYVAVLYLLAPADLIYSKKSRCVRLVREVLHERLRHIAGQNNTVLVANLLDIHNQRLAHMDATGVDFVGLHIPLYLNSWLTSVADRWSFLVLRPVSRDYPTRRTHPRRLSWSTTNFTGRSRITPSALVLSPHWPCTTHLKQRKSSTALSKSSASWAL